MQSKNVLIKENMEFNLEALVRENIKKMQPYSSARDEFSGVANVFLDANENAFGSPFATESGEPATLKYNRYPDPHQSKLKGKISGIKGVPPQNIFIGNGSDEAIDLLIRIFCEPGIDNVILLPPTYGMYKVCADINNVQTKEVFLTFNFQLDLNAIADAIDQYTKIIFICSPNNPTGNSINKNDIEILLNNFDGIIVIDEAYINFAKQKTFIPSLTDYPNLVILQTLSKAWGLAALRLGMAFASESIVNYMNKVKYPYNINEASQDLALSALQQIEQVNNWIKITVQQRDWMKEELLKCAFVEFVFPSDANFILVKMKEAKKLYKHLEMGGIIVRDRSNIALCNDCLRFTIGTPEENMKLIEQINNYLINSNE